MDLKKTHTYEAPLSAVLEMLRDRDATVARYQSMGHHDIHIDHCEATAESLRVASSRIVDVDLPGFAKRVLKPTNTMIQTDEWHLSEDGSWEGTFDVEVSGAPVHISGTMSLSPAGGQTVHEITAHVDVSVPLIGGRIADWAGKGDVNRSIDGEYSFNDTWLEEHTAAA